MSFSICPLAYEYERFEFFKKIYKVHGIGIFSNDSLGKTKFYLAHIHKFKVEI
jgi:hypothetical protein